SNRLSADSEQNVKVPRESTYDAEMCRILVNCLAKVLASSFLRPDDKETG
ncbi:4833_t:CDS:2, partial [Cetraspora pellucida]